MNNKMKKAINFLIITPLLFPAQAISYDAVFNITGRVAANTCSLKSSRTQNISLGDHIIGQNNFGTKAGSQTKSVRWSLEFDCDPNTKINAYLNGRAESSDRTLLRLSDTSGSAKGVAIRTSYSHDRINWHWMALNQNTNINRFGGAGKTIAYFDSYYVQTESGITPGKANASMEMEITYQ